ncbi:hypothetical protein O9992_01910 [Vibrio lentus]|nr:hypothetical protein [Vibrio lentus]
MMAIHGETIVAEIKDGAIHGEDTLTPADFGLNTHPLEAIGAAKKARRKQSHATDILTGKGTEAQVGARK